MEKVNGMKIKTDKREHPISETFICHDCVFVFTTHSKPKQGKKYFCPCCGDGISITKYKPEKIDKRIYKVWTDDEIPFIDKVINGEALIYQVAVKLNRSFGSVRKKVELRKKELEEKNNDKQFM